MKLNYFSKVYEIYATKTVIETIRVRSDCMEHALQYAREITTGDWKTEKITPRVINGISLIDDNVNDKNIKNE